MQPIIPPLKPGDQKEQVANLQKALLVFLDKKIIGISDQERAVVGGRLKEEKQAQFYGKTTGRLVMLFRVQHQLNDHREVDAETAAAMNKLLDEWGLPSDVNGYEVHGRVTDIATGQGKKGILVRAYDRDLRKEQLLGEIITNEEGYYKIQYTLNHFTAADAASNGAPDLLVRAVANDDQKLPLSESPIRFNANRTEVIDLTVAASVISEWQRITEAILPLLQEQGENSQPLQPWELNLSDLDFLVADTGIDRNQLSLWIQAFQIGRNFIEELNLPTIDFRISTHVHPSTDLSTPVLQFAPFYGWFRDGQPQDFTMLIQRPAEELVSSLGRAVQQNYIPALDPEWLERLPEALQALKIDLALRPASDNEPSSLGDLFNTIYGDWLTDKRRKKAAHLAITVDFESDEFLTKAKEAGFKKSESLQLRRTLQLGDLTLKHAPMVHALQAVLQDSNKDTVHGLAILASDRWLDLAFEHGVPPATYLTPEDYAEKLEFSVEAKVPTAVLAAKLHNKSIVFEPDSFKEVLTVLQSQPAFDITNADLDQFAKEQEIKPETASALGKLQHLKRLDARWDEIEVLVNSELDSAAQITQYGRTQFKDLLSERIRDDRIDYIYDQAVTLKSMSIGLMGNLQSLINDSFTPAVLNSYRDNPKALEIIDSSPTLRKLFGPQDHCACEPCMSVLSPAAYLVDLLKFIDASIATGQNGSTGLVISAGRELRHRRSDIYDLELSCNNSQIELPQIDLALEILEGAVAFPYPVSLPVGTNIHAALKANPITGPIRDALQLTAVETLGPLSAQPDEWTLRPRIYEPGVSYWIVRDQYRRWVLKAEADFFGLQKDSSQQYGLTMSQQNLELVIASLNNNQLSQLPQTALTSLKAALAGFIQIGIPYDMELNTVKVLEASHRWQLSFILSFSMVIDQDSLIISNTKGEEEQVQYSIATINQIEKSLNRGKIPKGLLPYMRSTLRDRVTISTTATGWVAEIPSQEILIYQTASLNVEGLSYQSTPTDRDLFVRPQNHNPLAYSKLAGTKARFPWTLPYDHPLLETRKILNISGISRLSLLELSSGKEIRYTAFPIARERLGLSYNEWNLIADSAIDGAGQPKLEFWRAWGLNTTSATQISKLFDTYTDQEIEALPFGAKGLLSRVSIVLQQARLKFDELNELLQSDFINPGGTVLIKPDTACKPSEMSLENIEAAHLDRLHRFVRLWRATGWKVWELDLVLEASGIGNKKLNADALVQIANLLILKSRLDLSIQVIASMMGGFTQKRYIRYEKGKQQEIIPLYDRLFQDPRLVNPPDAALAFNAPVNSPTLLSAKSALIAAALGIRATDLIALLNENEVDPTNHPGSGGVVSPENLHWIFRNATLVKTLNLSLTDYVRTWRLLNGQHFSSPASKHFSSPASLLAFLDDIEFIRQSEFSWSELEYILRLADPDQWEFGLTVQRAADILAALQSKLRQADVPQPQKAEAHFPLSEQMITGLPPKPATSKERWERWGLKQVQGSTAWSVIDPDDNTNTKTIQGPPLTLLKQVKVLAQQANRHVYDIKDALQTVSVDPVTPQELAITISAGNEVISTLKEIHLDRLERFLALQRLTKLNSRELDLFLKAFSTISTTTDPYYWDLSESVITSGKAMLTLHDRLQLPIDVIISWWGGLGNRLYQSYSLPTAPVEKDVFERLELPQSLKLNSVRDKLSIEETPPPNTPVWKDFYSGLAQSFGVAIVDIIYLIKAGIVGKDVSLKNLSTMHRWLKLAQALGVSTLILQRLQAQFKVKSQQDAWDSPALLLEFVDMSASIIQFVDLVVQHLSEAFSLDPEIGERLLWQHLHTSDTTPRPAIQLFIDPAFRNLSNIFQVSQLKSTEEYSVLIRLHKYSLLHTHWKETLAELTWIGPNNFAKAAFSGLVLDSLPTPLRTTGVATADWKRSTALYGLAHSLPAMSVVIEIYLEAFQYATTGKEAKDARASLNAPFGLSKNSNTVDVCAQLLQITTDAHHLDPLRLVQLIELLSLLQRLGIEETELKILTEDEPTLLASELGRKLLRHRFGDKGWQKALRKVSDELRVQQRGRLVDYLLAKENLRNANALYEHYLIDIEMSPCMNTTRLLQSTAAAQLFVQRCLFNLEKNVPPKSFDRDRWEWMQNYRVWEANRKVFLYPENWLFPEIRDDRSETFRAFESALTQSEPSHENAVKALRQYLDDLVEVSQISVIGMYEHAEETPGRGIGHRHILYLVGRSPNPPYTFFWRKGTHFGEPGMRWTGWERIDLDLSGDHIIPFIFEGDFHIAWPLIKHVNKENTDKFVLQLAWARLTSSGWTKRKMSREQDPPLEFQIIPSRDERSMFAFKILETQLTTLITCYVAKEDPSIKRTLPNENKIIPIKSSINSDVVGTKKIWFKIQGYEKYEGPTLYKPINVSAFVEYSLTVISKITVPIIPPLYSLNIPNLVWNLIIHIYYDNFPSLDLTYDLTQDAGDSTLTLSINAVFPKGSNTDPADIDRTLDFPMVSIGEYIFEKNKDVLWKERAGELLPSLPGVFYWSSGLLEQKKKDTGLQGVFSRSSASDCFFAMEAGRSIESSQAYSSWLVEEGRTRFLVKLNTSNPSSGLAIFPSAYTEAFDYKVRFGNGSKSLFNLESQDKSQNKNAIQNTWFGVDSLTTYFPNTISANDPRNIPLLAFHLGMPNSLYNWEVFYHLPLAVATFLTRQHRFEEARTWFHFIFDPTTDDPNTGRERFWRFLPFRNAQAPATITKLLETLSNQHAPENEKEVINQQISAWLEDPFNPFAVARLRTSAFEWYTVIAYIKNLMTWADQLFRRDTRESINEATLLYILAAQILGPQPEKIRKRVTTQQYLSYRALQGKWDDFSNVWLGSIRKIGLKNTEEGLVETNSVNAKSASNNQVEQLSSIRSLYFCVPPNEKLPELWDLVDDRLFKIRHCQNIEGITRSLPLFEPPIDPELLIRAKAAGLDLAGVLAGQYAPLAHYRFQMLLQKANDFCNEVKSLGGSILSAIEKKEAEHLSLLRSQQEIEMLKLIESVKEEQVKEAQANIESLQRTRNNAVDRFAYLQHQLGKNQIELDGNGIPIVEQALKTHVQETGAPDDLTSLSLIGEEINQVEWMQVGTNWTIASQVSRIAASVFHAISIKPENKPWAEPLGHSFSALGDGLGALATNASFWERRASLISGWLRRRDEWVQQSKMTAEEIRQIDKQIIALEIRKSIAERELDNHRQQIEHARNIDDYMRHLKFSGESLYAWMESQLSGLYFSAYQMAYDLAKGAEQGYRFELGEETSSFIRFGHWDNLRKGLLSGERLSQDLRRMEAAYLQRNRRDFELTKHVSIAALNPLSLLQLKETGKCNVSLPEELFDLDYQGHYFRRIKSVSLSIPCIAGPFTTINCTLRLLKNSIRARTSVGDYARDLSSDDNRFRDDFIVQSIATSSSQNDSGLFELNFRDERYIPFEGKGVVSDWSIELTEEKKLRQFDYDTISDVILHIRYTAREDASQFKDSVVQHLEIYLKEEVENSTQPFMRLFSLKHDFPESFHQLVNTTGTIQRTEIKICKNHFPVLFNNRSILVAETQVFLKPESITAKITAPTDFKITVWTTSSAGAAWSETFGSTMKKSVIENLGEFDPITTITIEAGATPTAPVTDNGGLKKEEIEDLLILFKYNVKK